MEEIIRVLALVILAMQLAVLLKMTWWDLGRGPHPPLPPSDFPILKKILSPLSRNLQPNPATRNLLVLIQERTFRLSNPHKTKKPDVVEVSTSGSSMTPNDGCL